MKRGAFAIGVVVLSCNPNGRAPSRETGEASAGQVGVESKVDEKLLGFYRPDPAARNNSPNRPPSTVGSAQRY